jgi:CBS domain-containing protein
MQVKDAMTPHVDSVAPDTPVDVAARRMRDENVGCLPVAEGDRLVGMVTDRDLVVRALAEGRGRRTVGEVMSSAVLCCHADQPVKEAARLMEEHQVRRLVVLDREDRPVGVVSLHDLSGGGLRTEPYEVTFYREVVDSTGHPREVSIATVRVTGSRSKEAAEAAAIASFERDHDVSAWSDLAKGYKLHGPGCEQD